MIPSFSCVLGFNKQSHGVIRASCSGKNLWWSGKRGRAGGNGGQRSSIRQDSFRNRNLVRSLGFNPGSLVFDSPMSARVNITIVQNEHQFYRHSFLLIRIGSWAVDQQAIKQHQPLRRRLTLTKRHGHRHFDQTFWRDG